MGVQAIYLSNSCTVQMNHSSARNKRIWSMSIFPRHLVLSLVILLKITHQLVQICFLIGPQHTCLIFLALGPRGFCREGEGGILENIVLQHTLKDSRKNNYVFNTREKRDLSKYRDRGYRVN